MTSQGPKVSDEKLREMCSAVVEGISLGCIFSSYISSLSRFCNLEEGQTRLRHAANDAFSSPLTQLHFFLRRTTGRIHERASEETSGARCPWYSWTSWTSRSPWSSWRGRASGTPWTSRSQGPPRFLWNSWCTWPKRSERILKLKSLQNIIIAPVKYQLRL